MSDSKPCANWLIYDAIRQTVVGYEDKWGAHDREPSVLTELQMTINCMECNMKPALPSALEAVTQTTSLLKDPILTQLEKVGMKRKCYKPTIDKE